MQFKVPCKNFPHDGTQLDNFFPAASFFLHFRMHHWRPLCGNLFQMYRQTVILKHASPTKRNLNHSLAEGTFLFLSLINPQPTAVVSCFAFVSQTLTGKLNFPGWSFLAYELLIINKKRKCRLKLASFWHFQMSCAQKIIEIYLNSLSRYIFTQAKIGNGLPDIWRLVNTDSKF